MGWLIGILIFFGADVMVHEHHKIMDDRQPPTDAGAGPGQSWDQENLKRDDAGCPTAIYVAPGGELEEC